MQIISLVDSPPGAVAVTSLVVGVTLLLGNVFSKGTKQPNF